MRLPALIVLPAAVAAIAVAAPAAAHVSTAPKIIHVTTTYLCNRHTPKNAHVYAVTGNGNRAGVFIDAGCPSGFTATVKTCTDGAHVRAGAGGTIARPLVLHIAVTWRGRCGAVHQDGIQVLGGHHIRCIACRTGGVLSSGSNGAWFVSEGRGGHELPLDVICDHCLLVSNNTGVVIGRSRGSGVTNSTLRGLHHGCVRITHKGARAAIAPVYRNNHCLAGA